MSSDLFVPRHWSIVKVVQCEWIVDPREMLIDVELAASRILNHSSTNEIKHFDELLEEARQSVPVIVYIVTLCDDISGKQLELKMRRTDEDGVKAFVEGLNESEQLLLARAMEHELLVDQRTQESGANQ